ncbi:hypothetical protein V7S43_014288 [Phytophthora oleae]|uniref:Uncharacterized protein n=1 Tax=Phytophthora oleae TaxID=2107226 RepID=A0ABD3F1E3_9STRA
MPEHQRTSAKAAPRPPTNRKTDITTSTGNQKIFDDRLDGSIGTVIKEGYGARLLVLVYFVDKLGASSY